MLEIFDCLSCLYLGQGAKSKAAGKKSPQVSSNLRGHLKQFVEEKQRNGGSSLGQ